MCNCVKVIRIKNNFSKWHSFQDWLNPYCEEKNSNAFAWMTRNIHINCPVDGATIVIMSKLLKVWFRIITYDGIWDTVLPDNDPEVAVMFLIYCGDGKFVRLHVGKFHIYIICNLMSTILAINSPRISLCNLKRSCIHSRCLALRSV